MKNIIWLDNSYKEQDEDEDEDEGISEYVKHEHMHQIPNMTRVIQTPLGTFRMDNKIGNPYANNDIWLAMVNFDITQQHTEKIESVNGVEGLRIISRYSFVIVVGVLFDSEIVKWEIESVLGIERINIDSMDGGEDRDIPPECIEKISLEVARLVDISKYWYLYFFPNGEIRSLACKDKEEYDKNMQPFIQLKRLSYGILLASDEQDTQEITDETDI